MVEIERRKRIEEKKERERRREKKRESRREKEYPYKVLSIYIRSQDIS